MINGKQPADKLENENDDINTQLGCNPSEINEGTSGGSFGMGVFLAFGVNIGVILVPGFILILAFGSLGSIVGGTFFLVALAAAIDSLIWAVLRGRNNPLARGFAAGAIFLTVAVFLLFGGCFGMFWLQ